MMKTFTACAIIAFTVACVGCSRSRAITLDEGLQGVKDRKYSLVAVTDEMISFQVDSTHKYQYYADRTAIDEAMTRLNQALDVASNAGFTVSFMDARNHKSNQNLQGTSRSLGP